MKVIEAIGADRTNVDTMKSLGVCDLDATVVAIGSNILANILTAFNMKELNCKMIYIKALSEEHALILKHIGVHYVVFPEKYMAINIARRIHNPNLVDFLPFHEDYAIFVFAAPKRFHGKMLKDLDLINKYGVQAIAVRKRTSTFSEKVGKKESLVFVPKAHYTIQEGDVLVLIGPQKKAMGKRHQDND